MNRSLRISVIAAACVIGLAVAAGAIFLASFDPNSLKPRIVDAVRRMTGRELTVAGNIRLEPSLWPTIDLAEVSLSNPPGFSRPQMATLRHLRLEVSLPSLLAHQAVIERLVLVDPDILLETDRDGHPNWQFTREAEPSGPPAAGPADSTSAASTSAASGTSKRVTVSVQAISIQDGLIAYRDGRTGGLAYAVQVPALTATAATPDAPVHIEASAIHNGMAFTLAADTGSFARLQDRQAVAPWPVKLTLSAAGAHVTADGSIARPLLGQGYDLSLTGGIPDLGVLAPLLPGQRLPDVHDIAFTASIAGTANGPPRIRAMTLHTGAAGFGAIVLDKIDAESKAFDQPIKAEATGTLNGAPVTIVATAGSPLTLPVPVDATIQAAGTTMAVKLNLSPSAGGFRDGVTLAGLTVASPDLDLTGDASVTLQPRPALKAQLAAGRIDLDAIQTLADKLTATVTQPPAPPGQATPSPGAEKPGTRQTERLFSDQPVPFGTLREADADLRLSVGVLRAGGGEYRKIATHVVLDSGKLSVDPLSADLPQGHLDATGSIDAGQANPTVRVRVRAPGLALKPLLIALRQPPVATGNLEVYADLDGAGTTPHAIAGSANGTLGLAVAGGTIDNRIVGGILGRVMAQINALDLVGRGGSSDLRCFATRLDIRQGLATVRALTLSSALLTATGSGTANLGNETMDLMLKPEVRIAGNILVIPVRLSGPMRNPGAAVNQVGSVADNAGSIAGAVIGGATPLGALAGMLGAGKVLGGGDPCPSALAAARGQAVADETTGRSPLPALTDPAKALRNLFR